MSPITKQLVDEAYNTLSYAVTNMPDSVTFDVVPKVLVRLAELLEIQDFKNIQIEFGTHYLTAILDYYVYIEEFEKCAKIQHIINL